MTAILLIILAAILPVTATAQMDNRDCPGCDLPLGGFAIGGHFGLGTFSVDSDSPSVAGEMGLEATDPFGYHAGGGFYFFPGDRFKLGIMGGAAWNGVESGDEHVKSLALWGTVMPEMVRTTGSIRLSSGLGIGGGLSSAELAESGVSSKEQIPMFVLAPKVSFEIPFGTAATASIDLMYLWFMGEDRMVSLDLPDTSETRELPISPVEFGGPSVHLSLYFGNVYTKQR